MTEAEKLREEHRLALLIVGILNKLEECASKLRNGFLDENDYNETKKTMNRLYAETLQIDSAIEEKLDSSSKT